jgi:hypothetical protein
MKKYSIEVIEKAFNDKKIECPFNEFIETLDIFDGIEKEAEKQAEEINKNTKEVMCPQPVFNTVEEFITTQLKSHAFTCGYYDMFGDEKLNKDGAETIDYFKIGGKVHEVVIACEVEWCFECDSNRYIPTRLSIKSTKEITNFEVLDDSTEPIGYITILLK